MSSNYSDPVELLLENTEAKTPEKIVDEYVDFLLTKSGVKSLPVDLSKIISTFGLEKPKLGKLGKRRGMFDPVNGIIFVNSDDKKTVQRFTIAHELMEMLLTSYNNKISKNRKNSRPIICRSKKERLCEVGAAKILMPMSLFKEEIKNNSVSFCSAMKIANRCQTSLTSTIRRMVNSSSEKYAFIIWRYKNTSKELKPDKNAQKPLFEELEVRDPPKKLRIYHVTTSPKVDNFIPYEKSISQDTKIYKAYRTGERTEGYDRLDLVHIKGYFYTESFPFEIEGERQVMSLIHLENRKNEKKRITEFL